MLNGRKPNTAFKIYLKLSHQGLWKEIWGVWVGFILFGCKNKKNSPWWFWGSSEYVLNGSHKFPANIEFLWS